MKTRSIPWLRKFAASGGIRLAAQGLAKEVGLSKGKEVFPSSPIFLGSDDDGSEPSSERAEAWLKIIAAGINAVLAVPEHGSEGNGEDGSEPATVEWSFPLKEALQWVAGGFLGISGGGSAPSFNVRKGDGSGTSHADQYSATFEDLLSMEIAILPPKRSRMSRADPDGMLQHMSLVDLLASALQTSEEHCNAATKRLIMELFAAACVLGESSARLVWDKLGRQRRWTDGISGPAGSTATLATIVSWIVESASEVAAKVDEIGGKNGLSAVGTIPAASAGSNGNSALFPQLGHTLGAVELCNALIIGVAEPKEIQEAKSLSSIGSPSTSGIASPSLGGLGSPLGIGSPIGSPLLQLLPKRESPAHILARRTRRRMELERHGFSKAIEELRKAVAWGPVITRALATREKVAEEQMSVADGASVSDKSTADGGRSGGDREGRSSQLFGHHVSEIQFQITVFNELAEKDRSAILAASGAGSDVNLVALAGMLGIDVSAADLGESDGALFQSAVVAALASIAANKGISVGQVVDLSLKRGQGSKSTLLGRLLDHDETASDNTPRSRDEEEDEELLAGGAGGSSSVNMKAQIREALKHVSVAQDRLLQAYKEEDERSGNIGPLSPEEVSEIMRKRFLVGKAGAGDDHERVPVVSVPPLREESTQTSPISAAGPKGGSSSLAAMLAKKAGKVDAEEGDGDGGPWLSGIAKEADESPGGVLVLVELLRLAFVANVFFLFDKQPQAAIFLPRHLHHQCQAAAIFHLPLPRRQ